MQRRLARARNNRRNVDTNLSTVDKVTAILGYRHLNFRLRDDRGVALECRPAERGGERHYFGVITTEPRVDRVRSMHVSPATSNAGWIFAYVRYLDALNTETETTSP